MKTISPAALPLDDGAERPPTEASPTTGGPVIDPSPAVARSRAVFSAHRCLADRYYV
jgi:hypothetical protein